MKVVSWPISRVKPYKNNPRVHNDAIDAIAKSIEEFGFQQPIVVDTKGVILAGHGRYYAILKLGRKSIHVRIANLSGAKARAYRIADNKTNELSQWDGELLAKELEELEDYDWKDFGFNEQELNDLAEGVTTTNNNGDDAAPSAPKTKRTTPATKPERAPIVCPECGATVPPSPSPPPG